jgi:hypothetical protein
VLIKVIYQNDKFDMVKPSIFEELLPSGKLKKFFRSGSWATMGIDPIRGMGGSYEGPERRKISTMKPPATEERLLLAVADECEYLTLIDGSVWHINPDDMPAACTWIPPAEIRIKFVYNGSMFPYELTNIRTSVSVRAMKI